MAFPTPAQAVHLSGATGLSLPAGSVLALLRAPVPGSLLPQTWPWDTEGGLGAGGFLTSQATFMNRVQRGLPVTVKEPSENLIGPSRRLKIMGGGEGEGGVSTVQRTN